MSDEGEEFLKIKELFCHLNQMIHVTGSKESYQMLFYLPDTDPNFHKLELVKGLRMFLRESLISEIDGCISSWLDESRGKMREENNLQQLCEKFYNSQIYNDVKIELENSLQSAVSEMSSRPVEELFYRNIGDNICDYSLTKSSPMESNEISLNSSFNQSGYLFINPAQYNNIAESLKKKHLYENFQNTLDLLLAVTPGEPVSQTVWPSIRKSLKELLLTDDDKSFQKSIKFHSRLLSSQVYNAVKEGFLNVVEALSEFWMSRKLVQRLKKNINDLFEDNKIFALLYMLIEFLKEFPALWIRYPTQYVNDMIDAFFSLFNVTVVQKGEILSFYDILCLIDPKALWFYSWMHGQLGRRVTLNALKNKSSIMSYCLSNSFAFIEQSGQAVSYGSNNRNLQYLEFFKFNHSLSILFCIIEFSEGRMLFPLYDNLKKEHFSLKKCLHGLSSSVKLLKQNIASKILIKQLIKICNTNENICKVFCETGLVDSLVKIFEPENFPELCELNAWFLQSFLKYFSAVNSTSVGHEYLLTGKLQKTTSKIVLSSNIHTPAQILFNFTNNLITHQHSFPGKVMQLSFNLSCSLLHSPLGRHLLLYHPLIENIILYLQEELNANCSSLSRTICKIEQRGYVEEYFEFVIEKLLLSHKGLLLLEKNEVLSPIMNLTLPLFFLNGKLSNTLLTKIACSVQGCVTLGENEILKSYWITMKELMEIESLIRPPLEPSEINDILEEALIPLLCISSTFEGTKLLYSELGLLNEIKHHLFSPEEQETEIYSLVLKILGSSTFNLDGILLLQVLFNLQEQLFNQQMEQKVGGYAVIDENSIMRTHILNCFYIPKGTENMHFQSFIPDGEVPETLDIFCNLMNSGNKNLKDKPKGVMSKKQGELWQFLNETRIGLHDATWLNHCRRAFRNELLNNDETKVSQFMEMIDLCLDCLLAIPDEVMPNESADDFDIEDEIPSPISSSYSNNIYCYPPTYSSNNDSEKLIPALSRQKISQHLRSVDLPSPEETHPPSSLGIEIMIRYGAELNLIPNNDSQPSNLLKLKLAVDSFLVANKQERFDWFSVLIYFITAGNVDKSFSFLRKLKALKIGSIIWPNLMGSLWVPLKLAPTELMFSSVIHCTKLVLYRDNPTAYLALEDIGGGIIWNIISEWINQSFIGILQWPENIHIILVSLLYGGDYLVYALVCLLLSLHKNLIERITDSEFRKIIFIQTEMIHDWKVRDHFLYMDTLCKRFRRIVMETIYPPLSK